MDALSPLSATWHKRANHPRRRGRMVCPPVLMYQRCRIKMKPNAGLKRLVVAGLKTGSVLFQNYLRRSEQARRNVRLVGP